MSLDSEMHANISVSEMENTREMVDSVLFLSLLAVTTQYVLVGPRLWLESSNRRVLV